MIIVDYLTIIAEKNTHFSVIDLDKDVLVTVIILRMCV